MAPKLRKINKKQKLESVNLTNFDCALCPICCSILIEPVTTPCGHHFCLNCFNETVNNASLCCPLCRTRISSWLRVARKENNLINLPLWNEIQTKFGSYVQSKLAGNEGDIDNNLPKARRIIATPGEIKKEYEVQRQSEQNQILKERLAEEEKSNELIKKLQEEELLAKKLEEEKLRRDEELARKLAKEEQLAALAKEPITPKIKKGPLDAYLSSEKKKSEVKKSIIKSKSRLMLFDLKGDNVRKDVFPVGMSISQRRKFLLDDSVDYMDRLLCDETDNTIDQEITHIKPITLVPKTPPKFDKNGKIMENSLIRTTPIRLVQENIEYHRVKSPDTNLIAEHHSDNISAFKSTSPPKLEDRIFQFNNLSEAESETSIPDDVKRLITFDDQIDTDICMGMFARVPSPTAINCSPRSNSVQSPFIGFSQNSVTNEHFTKFKKLFNNYFPNNNENFPNNNEADTCDNNYKENNDECCDENLIISQQKRVEEMLIQERQDFELARKLFEELNAPETNKKYSLRAVRSNPNRTVQSRKRQSTIQELCSRKKLKMQ